jgi:hypothetical protein
MLVHNAMYFDTKVPNISQQQQPPLKDTLNTEVDSSSNIGQLESMTIKCLLAFGKWETP